MNSLKILVLFLVLGAAGAAKCYTKTCKQNYKTDYVFYDSTTYGGDIHPNPTTPISANRQYRDFVNSVQPCSGNLCNGQTYSCSKRGTKNCYHVEHIIDQNGNDPQIPASCGKCRNVPGNMVMANGQWNSAVGGLAGSSYSAANSEKRLVYGDTIVNRAYASISACCNRMGAQMHPMVMAMDIDPNVTYSESCDDDMECNCDSGIECGCDCDYDDASTWLYASAVFSAITVMTTTINMALLIAVLVFLLGVSICGCYMCHKTRTQKRPSHVQLTEQSNV